MELRESTRWTQKLLPVIFSPLVLVAVSVVGAGVVLSIVFGSRRELIDHIFVVVGVASSIAGLSEIVKQIRRRNQPGYPSDRYLLNEMRQAEMRRAEMLRAEMDLARVNALIQILKAEKTANIKSELQQFELRSLLERLDALIRKEVE